MKRLLIVLVILAVLGVAAIVALGYADLRARELAESEIERRLAAAMPIEGTPDVEIEAFPFVGQLLLDGTVEQIRVELAELRSSGVRVERIQVVVERLQLDRDALLGDGKVVVEGIGGAAIDGWVAADDVAKLAPVPVRIENGRIEVIYEGRTYAGTASVSKHAIVLLVDGMPPILAPLPETDYLPCEPAVDIQGDHLHVACEVDALPEAVASVLAEYAG